jgi:hypothetical protein
MNQEGDQKRRESVMKDLIRKNTHVNHRQLAIWDRERLAAIVGPKIPMLACRSQRAPLAQSG